MGNGIDGSGRNTDNLVKAAIRSARSRQCPACGRKSALVRVDEEGGFRYRYCRWCHHVVSFVALPYRA